MTSLMLHVERNAFKEVLMPLGIHVLPSSFAESPSAERTAHHP